MSSKRNPDNKTKGIRGEDLACEYLEDQGFEILERNYRFGRGEVDIIGLKGNKLLIFVEVKLRSRSDFGEAESFVSYDQQQMIMEVAEEYIYAINWKGEIRFDILAIDKHQKITPIADAFS